MSYSPNFSSTRFFRLGLKNADFLHKTQLKSKPFAANGKRNVEYPYPLARIGRIRWKLLVFRCVSAAFWSKLAVFGRVGFSWFPSAKQAKKQSMEQKIAVELLELDLPLTCTPVLHFEAAETAGACR